MVGGANLHIEFDPSVPIYLQIVEEIKRLVATGKLKAGDKLPSQRELAAMLRVNTNTVQHAYREMELEGFVETLRGQGTFIRQDAQVVEKMRTEMIQRLVGDFVRSMLVLGCSEQSILELVKANLSNLQRHSINNKEGQYD